MLEPIVKIVSLFPDAKKSGNRWLARCPAHEDRKASLSIGPGEDGRVLLHCHAGCKTPDVLAAVGATIEDLFRPTNGQSPGATRSNGRSRIVATYTYHDEVGRELFQVVRHEPKDFRQRRPDGKGGWVWSLNGVRRVPYRLPELLGEDPSWPVFVVEGEKDADRLAALELVSTTNAGGAGKWLPEFSTHLAGRRVVILPDNDASGHEHAEAVARSLQGVAVSVRVVDLPGLPKKGDVSDWLDAGGTVEALRELVDKAGEWIAPAADRSKLVCLADVQPEPMTWLWPGRIPLGKLTLLVGDPKTGKSFLTVDLAARVSKGLAWPDGASGNDAASVLLLSADDDVGDTIRPRLDAAGADVSRVFTLSIDSLVEGRHDLERAIQDGRGVRLVVIDPITAYLGRIDSHKAAEVRGLLAPLAELASRYRVAIVAVSHLNKCSGGPAMYRATGSLAFAAAARALWLVVKDKQDGARRLLLPLGGNLAGESAGMAYRIGESAIPDVGRVAWEAEPIKVDADEALSINSPDDSRHGALQEASAWLTDVLSKGPVPAQSIKKRSHRDGIAPRTLDRAKAQLGVKASRKGFKRGSKWVWELPARSTPNSPVVRQPMGMAHYAEDGALRPPQGDDGQGNQVTT